MLSGFFYAQDIPLIYRNLLAVNKLAKSTKENIMLNTYLQDSDGQKGVNRHVKPIEYRMTATEFKRWRQLHGWTQTQAAKQLSISQAEIASYETIGKIPKHIEVILEKINY